MIGGVISEIRRFCTHDGDGIRTTIALKGCPLRCKWCHNPETVSIKPTIAFAAAKCTACGRCARICKSGVHEIRDGRHVLRRDECTGRGECVWACPSSALRLYGERITAAEAVKIALSDRPFFDRSGGGVTISGGEPLFQSEFSLEIARLLKSEGVSVMLDTGGFAEREVLAKFLPLTDKFLYDLKVIDPKKHRDFTGVDNKIILDNLAFLTERGADIEIRTPVIPGVNDYARDFIAAADYLKSIGFKGKVKLLPFNSYAAAKYTALGLKYPFAAEKRQSPEKMRESAGAYEKAGFDVVIG